MSTLPLGDQVRVIVRQMKSGVITYDQAREQAAPLLEEMNAIIKKRSKQAGLPFKKVTFEAFAR